MSTTTTTSEPANAATAPITPVIAPEPTHPSPVRFDTGDYEQFVAWMKKWVAWHTSPIKQQLDTPAGELVALQSRQAETAAGLTQAVANNETAGAKLAEVQAAHQALLEQLSEMQQHLATALKAAAESVPTAEPVASPVTEPVV
jgi:hypothetical protein